MTLSSVGRGVARFAILQALARLAALAVVPVGCSLAFVNGPPPNHQKLAYFDCSSSRALPTLDLLVAGAATVDAIAGAAGDLGASGLSSNNRASLAIFGTEAALFAASAIYGYSKTAECREAHSDMLKRAAQTPTLAYPPGYGGPYASVPGRAGSAAPPPYDPWVTPPPVPAPPPPILSPVGPLPPAGPAASPGSADRPIAPSGKDVQ